MPFTTQVCRWSWISRYTDSKEISVHQCCAPWSWWWYCIICKYMLVTNLN